MASTKPNGKQLDIHQLEESLTNLEGRVMELRIEAALRRDPVAAPLNPELGEEACASPEKTSETPSS